MTSSGPSSGGKDITMSISRTACTSVTRTSFRPFKSTHLDYFKEANEDAPESYFFNLVRDIALDEPKNLIADDKRQSKNLHHRVVQRKIQLRAFLGSLDRWQADRTKDIPDLYPLVRLE